jgi:hypothetical protein
MMKFEILANTYKMITYILYDHKLMIYQYNCKFLNDFQYNISEIKEI